MEALSSFLSCGIQLFGDLIQWLVEVIGHLGYPGIVGLMFLESSFFPFPSEVVIPPAGYLAWKGEMNIFLVIFSGIAGSILGGLFNYWIAVRWGRPIFEKYGKYFFVTHESLDKAEVFFARHGHISPPGSRGCRSRSFHSTPRSAREYGSSSSRLSDTFSAAIRR